MKRMTGIKRVLSMLLSMALLLSLLSIAGVSAASTVWDFESDALGQNISLSDVYTAVPTEAEHHSGSRALLLNGSKKAAAQRPQIILKDGNGAEISVTQGLTYSISFYVMLPQDAPDNRFFCWLTATDSTQAYTTTDQKNADLVYEWPTTKVAAKGQWEKVEVTDIVAPKSGKLRLGISINSNTAHTLYIDDVEVVVPNTPTPTPTPTPEWGFETDTLGTNVSLSDTYPAIPTEAEHYAGSRALAISGGKKSATKRAQITLKNGSGEDVTVTKDKKYNVSFYVMLPQDAPDNRYLCWLTATDSAQAYTTTDQKDAELLYEWPSTKVAAKGQWEKVEVTDVVAPKSGKLRLGISINSNEAQTLYIDNVLVEEQTPSAPLPPVGGPWSFEQETVGTFLDLNSNASTIQVSDAIAPLSGSHVAKVTSAAKSGNGRPQMTVTDAAGTKLYVYKGRSYTFTFNVFIPLGSNEYEFGYWLAATPDEKPFGTGYSKDSYVLAEVSEGTQPTMGQWVELSLTVSDCPYSGLLRFGVTGATNDQHVFYVDDLTLTETMLDYDVDAQSFEIYNDGDKLSLNTDTTAITATKEDAHAGEYAAKVVTGGNSVDGAAQLLVTDAAGDPITVQQGDRFNLSFYVCVPAGTVDTDVQYWLTAGDDTPFDSSHPRTGIVLDTRTLTVTDKGSWLYVLVAVDDCPADGKLRLGLTGTAAEAITFYLDDILVKERVAGATDTQAMNFEEYTIGENLSLATTATETMTVTNQISYTGLQSILVKSTSRAGDLRPQLMVKDGEGKQIKLTQGEDYYLHFMLFIPEGQSYFDVSYWAACVPDDKVDAPFVKDTDFIKNDYVVAEVSQQLSPALGEWVKIILPITDCKHSGNLRLGITHHTQGVKSQMYVDDIKIVPPQYVHVKFDTNGSKDVFEDVIVLADSLIPYSGIDPYLEGYEFMGWYTSEEFKREQYYDIATTPVTGVTGDVLTLYARWREWSKVVIDLGDKDDVEEPEYETKYYTEKVWVGDENLPDPLDLGERPGHKEATDVITPPDDVTPEPVGGMAPWLIVVIIVAAVVVVGGGAAVAAILLKKKKA